MIGAGGSQSGNITLTNGADLIHRGALLAGEITASDSQVLLDSGSVHVGATTQLTDNATLTVKGRAAPMRSWLTIAISFLAAAAS